MTNKLIFHRPNQPMQVIGLLSGNVVSGASSLNDLPGIRYGKYLKMIIPIVFLTNEMVRAIGGIIMMPQST